MLIDVRAVAVVVGSTVRIGPPAIAGQGREQVAAPGAGASPRRRARGSTTRSASTAAAGSHAGVVLGRFEQRQAPGCTVHARRSRAAPARRCRGPVSNGPSPIWPRRIAAPSRWPAVKVSTRGDYAARALVSLSLHADDSGPTSVRDIAERTGLPQPYLEQIPLALKGAGLVRSKRGVGGGYVLARPAEEITLADIVSAVDGPIVVGDFGLPHQDGACDHEGQCVLLALAGARWASRCAATWPR